MAGHVDLLCDQTTNAFPHLNGGKIKAYATTSPQRHENFPDIPTTRELGIPEVDIAVWHGVYAPKGTPAPIIAKLNAALRVALNDTERSEELTSELQTLMRISYAVFCLKTKIKKQTH